MSKVIGAQHEFHDEEFVAGWAERFAPTPERVELFNVILSELKSKIPSRSYVVELGIGPGYLADHLLKAMPEVQYCGVDFSAPMFAIAQQRLKPHSDRITYVQADLIKDDWWIRLPMSVNAIVSTWSLHDLGSQAYIEAVYENCAQVLKNGGVLLNGDFIKPDKTEHEYEPGRFEIAKHIEMLHRIGFKDVECLVLLEEEIESPTPAQNYACIKGVM